MVLHFNPEDVVSAKTENPQTAMYQSLVIPPSEDDVVMANGDLQAYARMAEVEAKTATLWMQVYGTDSKYFQGVSRGALIRSLGYEATSKQAKLTPKQRAEFQRVVESMVQRAIDDAERLTAYLTKEA